MPLTPFLSLAPLERIKPMRVRISSGKQISRAAYTGSTTARCSGVAYPSGRIWEGYQRGPSRTAKGTFGPASAGRSILASLSPEERARYA